MSEENIKYQTWPDTTGTINYAQASIAQLQDELATLKAALTKAEADRAVMREALELAVGFCINFRQRHDYGLHPEIGVLYSKLSPAMYSTSGSKLLERMEKLEKVVRQSENAFSKVFEITCKDNHREDCLFHRTEGDGCDCGIGMIEYLCREVWKNIRELDALQSKDAL